ncbi:Lrp/AsnC family transcriptional regulator [Chitinophaga polysaccharea]|uniref:Lrp/AsnC family transcriptional regulator n=1 Tax=Chitinophaga TaxID=79328 RepID=UPI0014554C7A|nr:MULTISPECIES: Lrp/AsnC family transcriptional regulator [Chitinophaga]NLR58672.1 Lrp/AsnC family transcriptional regulator [Chitinophaga polysaccharea]NLU91200.1 Lrp/AsnC family transcriptional regulator [Chitinophaga sp. Ak27]
MTFIPDQIDMCIMDILQEDARTTNKEIASRLGKSVTSIFERVKRLEAEGYIQRYIAVLNKHKLGKNLVAYTSVTLKEHGHDRLLSFEQKINSFPEVMECYKMNGQFDYLLKVLVADMEAYEVFNLTKLSRLDNIYKIRSLFVLSETKHEVELNLKTNWQAKLVPKNK